MSERYLITGVQLGIIQALASKDKSRVAVVKDVFNYQFIGNSGSDVKRDAKMLLKLNVFDKK